MGGVVEDGFEVEQGLIFIIEFECAGGKDDVD